VNFDTGVIGASVDIIVPECSVGTPNNTYSRYTTNGWVGISAYRGPDSGDKYGLIQTGKFSTIPRRDPSLTIFSQASPAPSTE
jgi:hypothetical protein